MKQNINSKKGQAVLDYMGLIIIVTIALFVISMRDFFQRAVQGQWKTNVDSISDIQYSSYSSYNISQGDWQMNVRTSDGTNFHKENDTALGHTVWYL